MLISARRAEGIAYHWWKENQGDFTHRCVIGNRAVMHDLTGRLVHVRLEADTTNVVCRLFVGNHGDVEVIADRRSVVQEILTRRPELAVQPDFEANRQRAIAGVLATIEAIQQEHPKWFSLVQAPVPEHSLTPDIIAVMVGYPAQYCKVRIKIVETQSDKAHFNSNLTDEKRLKMITLVIPNGEVRTSLKGELVDRLSQMRREFKLA
jgi:hypothetical protein